MASPYWSAPGVAQGRIRPTEAIPDHGFWDFCLGYDSEEPAEFMLTVGETIKLEQAYNFSPMDFVNFCWTMRTPSELPRAAVLVNAGTVRFADGSLFDTGDGCRGPVLPTSCFLAADTDQLLLISGSTNPTNNGTFRIGAIGGTIVPATKHVAPMFDRCVLENADMVAGTEYAVTVKLLGARWRAQVYVNDILRVELIEPANHETMRRFLKLHVSQVVGPATMSFRLTLESVTP